MKESEFLSIEAFLEAFGPDVAARSEDIDPEVEKLIKKLADGSLPAEDRKRLASYLLRNQEAMERAAELLKGNPDPEIDRA